MKRLPLDHTEQERVLLQRIAAAPADELRALLKALSDDELYLAQTVVGIAADRRIERDVEIQREVARVVAFRFPRGWPSPASSVPVGTDPGA